MTDPETDSDAGVELILRHEGREITVAVGAASAELDEVLAAHDAETWVFLPSGQPDEGEALEEARAKLPEQALLGGELVDSDADEARTFGVFVLDLRRHHAREVAKEWQLQRFFWGRQGSEVEEHSVGVLGDEDSDDDDSMLKDATSGLRDLLATLRGKPRVVVDGDLEPRNGWLLPLGAMALAGAGALAYAFTTSSPGVNEDVAKAVRVAFHPVVLPALLLGLLLRNTLHTLVDDRTSRELTAGESLAAWRRIAPRMSTVWIAAFLAVSGLTVARLWSAGPIDPSELVDDGSTNLLICLWALPPILYSRSLDKAVGDVIGAVIWLFIALVIMKVTLLFAGLAVTLVLGLLRGLVPFEISEEVEEVLKSLAEIGAELSLLVYMLGYTWTQARKHFVLWASDELPED